MRAADLDAVARRLRAQGAISDTYADLPFAARYPRILAEHPLLAHLGPEPLELACFFSPPVVPGSYEKGKTTE